MLSDIDSAVIRAYRILNDQVDPGDAFLYGIPYPGAYVCDETGRVNAKFFHDSYKKRDSAERLLAAAIGHTVIDESSVAAQSEQEDISIRVAVPGAHATIRQGIVREIIVRFELADGLHLYGEPVPEGMLPLRITVKGPPGFLTEPPVYPQTETLTLKGMQIELSVWHGKFDVRIPFYAVGELASEVRPLDQESAEIELEIRYQACDDNVCLIPRTERISLELPLEVVDVPAIAIHQGHGQREGTYDGSRHLRSLLWRKVRQHPLGFIRFIFKQIRLNRAARKRARG